MGLAVAHSIIDSMRGEFKIESVLGKGTTISIELPVLVEKRS